MAYDAPGGTGANLAVQVWDETIQSAVYDKSRFLQRTTDYGKPMSVKNIRKITAMTGASVANTVEGIASSFTFTSMNPAVVTITPAWFFAGHEYPDNLPWVAGDSISRVAADDAEMALTATLENNFLQDVASLTNYVGDGSYDVETAGFRGAVATLFNTGKVEAEPGFKEIYGLLGALQHDDAMGIPEFTHADQRGDGQNPLVSGIIGKGNAVRLMFSTLLYNDGSALHGVIWVPSAFGHGFNSRVKGEKQRIIKATYVMADCHFGHNIIHNARAIGVRTKTT